MRPVRTKLRLSINLHLYMQRRSPWGVKTVPSDKSRTGGFTRPTVLCKEELLLYLLCNIVQSEITCNGRLSSFRLFASLLLFLSSVVDKIVPLYWMYSSYCFCTITAAHPVQYRCYSCLWCLCPLLHAIQDCPSVITDKCCDCRGRWLVIIGFFVVYEETLVAWSSFTPHWV